MNFYISICLIVFMCTEAYPGFCQGYGVQFSSDTSWEQVIQRAKKSSKYILVDCYTTWCAPCREMDRSVYIVDSVGRYVNQRFESVRLQMDTSKMDDALVKARYAIAADFRMKYHISAYPTFLFFSPAGVLVHRGEGYHPARAFLDLVSDALNPKTQYYAMLRDYKDGKIDAGRMPDLIGNALGYKDTLVAREVAADYIGSTLAHFSTDSLYQVQNIMFLHNCLSSKIVRAGEKGFYLIYGHEKLIDSLVGVPRFAEWIVDF